MPTTTEICTLSLVTGSDIQDSNSTAAKTLKQCCDILTRQEGCQKVWYGTSHENPETSQLFINWNTKASHEKFMATDAYKPFREKLGTIHTGDPDVVHVDFCPESGVSEALSAPVTQVATFSYDDAPPETAFEGAKTLVEALIKDGTKVMGWAYGPTHEVIEKDGIRGKANKFLVGWESVEAHFDSHKTQVLQGNIHRLTTPEVKGIEQHHVQATAYQQA